MKRISQAKKNTDIYGACDKCKICYYNDLPVPQILCPLCGLVMMNHRTVIECERYIGDTKRHGEGYTQCS